MIHRFPSLLLLHRLMLAGACLPGVLQAADSGPEPVPVPPPSQGLWEAGGVFLVLILLVAVVLVVVAVWITSQLALRRWVPDDLRSTLRDHFQAGRREEAGLAAHADPSFLGQLMALVVDGMGADPNDAPEGGEDGPDARLEHSIVRVTTRLARSVNFCSSVMLMAPMLGLLAVVGGTIRAVDSNLSGATSGQSDLAAGVANASHVAMVGGMVGVAAFVLLLVFKRRFRARTEELRGTARGLVALLP